MTDIKILKSKETIRKQFLNKRKNISNKERTKKSKKITKKISSLPEFLKAKKIMIYSSFKTEVETKELIEKSLIMKKQIFAPLITNEKNSLMEAIEIYKWIKASDISKQKRKITKPNKLDLIIVPGIAFDKKGNRLGWGKGYFDRYLEKTNKHCIFIGVCFAEQESKKLLPNDNTDIKMDFLITDKKLIKF